MTRASHITLVLALALAACGSQETRSEEPPQAPATKAIAAAPEAASTPPSEMVETTPLDPSLVPPRSKAPNLTERGFPMHTSDTAPAATARPFQFAQENFGFVGNLTAVMSESPALLNSYFLLQRNLQMVGTLSPPEDNIVQMSIAMENECQYCVAGHTLAGKIFFKSPEEQIQALRKNAALPEPKFNALRTFALKVYESQGRVSDEDLAAFLDAGYSRAQALDVVANIAAKVMSNYANQLARTPLDSQISGFAEGLPFADERAIIPNG